MIHRSDAELSLDMLVFEGRNTRYGAFNLRQAYNGHLKDAFFFVTLCSLALGVVLPFILASAEKATPPVVTLPDLPVDWGKTFTIEAPASAGKKSVLVTGATSSSGKNYTIVEDDRLIKDVAHKK
jgi:hypothetical protein